MLRLLAITALSAALAACLLYIFVMTDLLLG